MKNKIILYNTKISDKIEELHGDKIPYGVLSTASCLENYDVRIIDGAIENLNLEDVKGSLCIGMSIIGGYQIKDALQVSKEIKKRYKEIPIVWGGYFPSMCTEVILENPNIDIVVRGQGELTFLELIKHIEQNKPFKKIKGISYKKNNKIINNPDRELEDINKFPKFPYKLLKIRKYKSSTDFLTDNTINYITSRGCPFNCYFCNDKIIYKRRIFEYSIKRVIQDLRFLIEKCKYNGVMFDDSTFFLRKERVLKICKEIIKNNWGIKWRAYIRLDELINFSEEELKILKKSGCKILSVGTESGNQETLDMINKEIRLEDLPKFIDIMNKYNFMPIFEFIVAFPNEPKNALNDTLNLIVKLKRINPNFNIHLFIYSPWPKTELYERAVKVGLKVPKDLEGWANFYHHSGKSGIVDKKYEDKVKRFKFYLSLAYTDKNKFVEKMARTRFFLNIFNFPIEWYLYKYFYKKNESKRKIKDYSELA